MRFLVTLFVEAAVSAALAVTLDVPRLPEPVFADREVSRDTALPLLRAENLRVFRLEMTFNATPSNNVQITLGRDGTPADGMLAAEETDFIIGWDCGEWFLRPRGLKGRHTVTPQDAAAACRRTLVAEVRVDAQGLPQSVSFSEKGVGAFGFEGLTLSPFPEWLRPGLWTHLRVTARGSDTANETVSAKVLRDGAVIILR